MTEITNETEFKAALKGLSLVDQRAVGARFVEHCSSLANDERITFATRVAGNKDAADDEKAAAFKSAKAAALDCYTKCGADADWSEQAGYFVARAASAIVAPDKEVGDAGPAWTAAMNCRMARTCNIIDADVDSESQETGQQYRILEDFLNS